jgi:hypothetical protein
MEKSDLMERPASVERRAYDLVVCGGGLAGLCAAVAAAREGLQVALVQDRPVLGGCSSSEIRIDVHGAGTYWPWACETGVIAELLDEERFRNPEEVFEGHLNSVWDLVLYEWATREQTLKLFLNTSARAAVMAAPGQLAAVRCSQLGTERELELTAPYFIDATGDGTVAALAGAAFRYGREARAEHDESFAPETADQMVMGSTIQFRARDLGRPAPFHAPEWAMKYPRPESIYWRSHKDARGGYWWIELAPPFHSIRQNEEIRHELLRHVLGVFDHIKNCKGCPDCPPDNAVNLALDWVGAVPGKRESRRVIGDVILTENHLRARTLFADTVAHGGWFLDLHVPGGILAMDERPERSAYDADIKDLAMVGPYPIPLGSLRSRDVRNLFLAGRCLSATHVAMGSARVMGTCAAMGQAVAAASTVAVRAGRPLDDLGTEGIRAVQQLLLKQDCCVPFARNEDPLDLARTAHVSASGSALLDLPAGDKWVELDRRSMQILPLSANRLDTVELHLENRSGQPATVKLALARRADMWDLSEPVAVASAEAVVAPGAARWVRFTLDASTTPGLWALVTAAAPGVFWSQRSNPLPATAVAVLQKSGKWRFEGQRGRWVARGVRLAPASSPYEPANVINGIARPECAANLWISDPAAGLPQALTLELAREAEVAEVRIAFDNNLGRITRSTPPLYVAPELASDYCIELLAGSAWVEAVAVTDNRHRHRVHKFKPQRASAVRLTVTAAGCGQARVYEVRIYGKGKS